MQLAATRPREPQARLGHRQRVLELGLFGRRERSGQPLLGAAARLLGALDRDLVGVLGDVGQHGDAVGQHLEEAATDEEDLLLSPDVSWILSGPGLRMVMSGA